MAKLFAHRGFVDEKTPENSVNSLKKAREFGFCAVEFDLWFWRKQLLLKHDRPRQNELNCLSKLEDFFLFKNEFEYWIDCKNLNQSNANHFLTELKKIIAKCEIDLRCVYLAPFITNHRLVPRILLEARRVFGKKLKFVVVCESLKNEQETKNLRKFLDENNIKFLSIFHELIDQNFVKTFADIEIFTWTVDDLLRLKKLEVIGVRNFATDKITPKVYEEKS